MAQGTCSTEGCDRRSTVRGLCGACYQRQRRTADAGPCCIDRCDSKQYSGELCAKHYTRLRRHGHTDDAAPTTPRPCGIEDCASPSRVRGWCNMHYRRWVLTGDPLKTRTGERAEDLRTAKTKVCSRCKEDLPVEIFPFRRESLDGRRGYCKPCGVLYSQECAARKREGEAPKPPKPPRPLCSIDGCRYQAITRGWCKGHYERWRRNGDAELVLRVLRPKRSEDDLAATEKACSKCKHVLGLDHFDDRAEAPDGKAYVCRRCVRGAGAKVPKVRHGKVETAEPKPKPRRARNPKADSARIRKKYAEDPEFRDKRAEYFRKYRQKYREDMRERQRARGLWTHYGMTLDEYEALYREQGGVCKICGSGPHGGPEWARKQWLSVDHCHDTGRIRGLLCDNCNIGLGKFKDAPALLVAAAEYLAPAANAATA